ncbi:MAG: hypothetical protein GY862_18240 [Gammaproteobacteria bacterium]|nr:hypothetical protein [Gammaproteobacteria bacterium]
MIQTHQEEAAKIPEIHLWLVSTGGFTKEALNYVNTRADIYASDYEGINQIFSAFGGN